MLGIVKLMNVIHLTKQIYRVNVITSKDIENTQDAFKLVLRRIFKRSGSGYKIVERACEFVWI